MRRGLCLSSRWGLGFFSCILVVGMVGRGPVLFSRHSPCLHSWGMREDWSVVGRVFSSFSWLYGLGEHISVVEREFLTEYQARFYLLNILKKRNDEIKS